MGAPMNPRVRRRTSMHLVVQCHGAIANVVGLGGSDVRAGWH